MTTWPANTQGPALSAAFSAQATSTMRTWAGSRSSKCRGLPPALQLPPAHRLVFPGPALRLGSLLLPALRRRPTCVAQASFQDHPGPVAFCDCKGLCLAPSRSRKARPLRTAKMKSSPWRGAAPRSSFRRRIGDLRVYAPGCRTVGQLGPTKRFSSWRERAWRKKHTFCTHLAKCWTLAAPGMLPSNASIQDASSYFDVKRCDRRIILSVSSGKSVTQEQQQAGCFGGDSSWFGVCPSEADEPPDGGVALGAQLHGPLQGLRYPGHQLLQLGCLPAGVQRWYLLHQRLDEQISGWGQGPLDH